MFITRFFEKVVKDYKDLFETKDRWLAVLVGVGLFVASLVIQTLANRYVGQVTSIAVPDLILDHIPTLNIDSLIIDAVLLVTLITVAVAVIKPKAVSFGLKTLALFFVVRSLLICLTHLGANPHQLVFNPHDFGYGIYNLLYNTTNDFFFSAHTGVPFLIALLFWQEKPIRIFYFITSILFGVSVLLAHIHYSIDVLAAPFVTYGIFQLSTMVFKRDYRFSLAKGSPRT